MDPTECLTRRRAPRLDDGGLTLMAMTLSNLTKSGRVDVLECLLFETCGAALQVLAIAYRAGFLPQSPSGRSRGSSPGTVTPTGSLVTGTSGTIGRGIADGLAREGAAVAVLAADKRGVDLWVNALDRSTPPRRRPRDRGAGARRRCGHHTPEQMASSVAMLQLDLADPDFRTETILGARAVRAHLVRDLSAMAMHPTASPRRRRFRCRSCAARGLRGTGPCR
jgi:hypothetical protein